MLWIHSTSSWLTFKDVFSYLTSTPSTKEWSRHILSPAIPPSNSTLIWRFFHQKMPTDTKLAFRGCHLPSMCGLCKHFIENDLYQLIDYPFSVRLWNWLKNTINQSIDFSSFTSILKVCNKGYIPQCSLVICVVVIATLEAIWQSRNDMRLKNKITSISNH